jgi:sugar phosphate isomerase/epimerase
MDKHAETLSRRAALGRAGLLAGAALAAKFPQSTAAAEPPAPATGAPGTFLYTLNTATLMGQKLGIEKEVEIAAKAGYQAIEPWIRTLEEYKKSGGSLPDLKKKIADSGLIVPSGIGFPEWVVDDDARRAKGVEQAKRDMELIGAIGGTRLAMPPSGATDLPKIELTQAAERYRVVLDAGDQIGVVPQLELWGFAKNLSRIGECLGVAIETGHPKACVLLDVFHIYKSGSDFHGVALASAEAIHTLHMNDYPADPPREKINDSYRVYPGDGVAPIVDILRALRACGGQKALSLELFSQKYWKMDPLEVARAGLEKVKAVAAKAMEA